MREYLVGYLLDALEPAEHEMVEAELARDPRLQDELTILSKCLGPLSVDAEHHEPPAGLAERTCEFVVRQAKVTLPPAPLRTRASEWSFTDMVVAAGIFLAATLLFFPAVNQSRFAARVTGCQNNLRQIGTALNSYSTMYGGFFPTPALNAQEGAVGMYAPCLIEHGLLDGAHWVVCPASPLADGVVKFRLPTRKEICEASANERTRLHALAGGSYGYTLGYVANGRYRATKNLGRPSFAIIADAPNLSPPYHSHNHGGCGQNVLFEDMHVQYLTTCKAHGCKDDIFTNDAGQVAPGLHAHDAVISPSAFRILLPVSQEAMTPEQ
jgi:hypothetical protein